MTEAALREAVLAALHRVVPDVTVDTVRAEIDLRAQVDMDSIDYLRFLVAVHDATGVDIPENEYRQVRTLDGLVAYLLRRLPAPGAAVPPSA